MLTPDQAFAHGQGAFQARRDQRLVNRLTFDSTDDPRADQGVRIDQRVAEEVLTVIQDAHRRPTRDLRQRRGSGVYLI